MNDVSSLNLDLNNQNIEKMNKIAV